MHYFTKYMGRVGLLRHRRGILKVCLLKCAFFLLFGFCKIGTGGHIVGMPLMAQMWLQASSPSEMVTFITVQTPQRPLLNFAEMPEFELESTSEGSDNSADTKIGVRPVLNQYLLLHVDQHRTKNTLVHCSTSLDRRIKLPLFVLYHTWKHFPA